MLNTETCSCLFPPVLGTNFDVKFSRVLLENLLPSHVARHFLTVLQVHSQSKGFSNSNHNVSMFHYVLLYFKGGEEEGLYSHKYENICVMFASIPNYKVPSIKLVIKRQYNISINHGNHLITCVILHPFLIIGMIYFSNLITFANIDQYFWKKEEKSRRKIS